MNLPEVEILSTNFTYFVENCDNHCNDPYLKRK